MPSSVRQVHNMTGSDTVDPLLFHHVFLIDGDDVDQFEVDDELIMNLSE